LLPLSFQLHQQFVERKGVDDVILFQPPLSGDARAQAQEAGVFVAVGVAVDDAFDSFGFCVRPEPPVQVEAIGVGVQLNPGSSLGASVDHRLLIHFVRLALQQ